MKKIKITLLNEYFNDQEIKSNQIYNVNVNTHKLRQISIQLYPFFSKNIKSCKNKMKKYEFRNHELIKYKKGKEELLLLGTMRPAALP